LGQGAMVDLDSADLLDLQVAAVAAVHLER
jgi:hypothetical protein